MGNLHDFYLNEGMREEVRQYLLKFLTEKAIEKVFAQEDTKAIAEAKEVIDEAFNNLEIIFQKKLESKEIKNEAR